MVLRKMAPITPSITRWSQLSVICIAFFTRNLLSSSTPHAPSPAPLSSGTTVFATPPTARMHDYASALRAAATCGGLMMAEKEGMLYMPRLLTVMLPDYASTRRPSPTAYSSGSSLPCLLLPIRSFIC